MIEVAIDKRSEVDRSYRSERARGLFNVSEEDGASFQLQAQIPDLSEDWQVGVVVGPSGSGKTSIGEALVELEGFQWWTGGRWSRSKPVIEAVGAGDFDQVTGVLSQVGLGSVPAWLRPHAVLSNGERFRADLAKLLLAKSPKLAVIDEFTSVLDRTVATVGSAAFVKALRKQQGRRVVLLTPHHDILDWVQPDWVFDTQSKELARGWLQPEAEADGEGGGDGMVVLEFTV